MIADLLATRCDLHLHSRASTNTDEWYSRLFGCPESYAEPAEQYEACKARGMSLVTLTDHDTIAGGLELVDRPDFFLSEEVTTRFPENGCVMHVLVWNITPADHLAIQERRDDVYRLSAYLNEHAIAHALAHPLLSPNWKLDAATFERCLLLFPTLELINGLTDARIEGDLPQILASLDEKVIAALSLKHGLTPVGAHPHRKAATAGSDDHVHRRCGTVFTEVAEPGLSAPEFLRRCQAGEGRPVGAQADLATFGLTVHNTTYHFLGGRAVPGGPAVDPFTDLSDAICGRTGARRSPQHRADFAQDLLTWVARLRLAPPPDPLAHPAQPHDGEDVEIVGRFAKVIDVALAEVLEALARTPFSLDIYGGIEAVRRLLSLATAATPFLCAASHLGRQEAQVRRLRSEWSATPLAPAQRRLAVFSDSLQELDGVSVWCERFAAQARQSGFDVLVPRCDEGATGPHRLPEAASFPLPLYTGMRLYIPSPLSTLDWLWRQRVTHVELATPGPMGLVGLLAARLLHLPVTASYHTAIPALATLLDGQPWVGPASRRLLGWFYRQADRVFAYARRSAEELEAMGVPGTRIEVLPIAVDPSEFTPRLRGQAAFRSVGVDPGDRPVILTVGRVSKEKNIPLIVDAVRSLQNGRRSPLLVVIGEGPEREALQARYPDSFVHFVGPRKGELLRRLYASARAFAFASTVDTLGLVNLEAMASGIPVAIPAGASVADLVEHGVSAELYPFGCEGLARALRHILSDSAYAAKLGRNARSAMVARWREAPFARTWQSFVQE